MRGMLFELFVLEAVLHISVVKMDNELDRAAARHHAAEPRRPELCRRCPRGARSNSDTHRCIFGLCLITATEMMRLIRALRSTE
jgi:hypothetical protein